MNKMLKFSAVSLSCLALAAGSAFAQEGHQMGMHMLAQTPDTRHELDFPPPMRQHMLANMRAHLEALSEILAALSASDTAEAGKIADARLGLSSAGAAACKPVKAGTTSEAGDMAAMMAQHMPEDMRAMGYAMHDAASKFAVEAAKTPPGGDLKPALAALSQVTQNCAACHSAYRLK
jgi:cytochrome c556